jgi:hypothetical protein
MSPIRSLLASAFLTAGLAAAAHADTGWNEGTAGDFSNDGLAPTAVPMVAGSNVISGTTGRSTGGVIDRDYFSITLPAGFQLDAIVMLQGTTFLGASGLGFIAVQAGPQMTVSPTSGSATGLLGWWHYNENDMGTDILPVIGLGAGATGFFGSLPAGSYTFWIQEISTGSVNYNFDFQVSAVPEPAAALLMLGGLAGVAGFARRQRRR